MKQTLPTAVLAIGLGAVCTSISAGIGDLDWMLGCWTSKSGASREVWVRHSDQQLIGFAVAVKDGEIVFHEVLSIDLNYEGMYYSAHPLGQEATTFTASGTGAGISFENPRHDYPQRIRYRREGNWLRATISLMDGSNPTSFDKMKCQ